MIIVTVIGVGVGIADFLECPRRSQCKLRVRLHGRHLNFALYAAVSNPQPSVEEGRRAIGINLN